MSTAKTFTRWRKASYSETGNECVEVGTSGDTIGVRDTKQQGRGPVLEFSAAAWGRFVERAKAGDRTMQ